MARFDTLIHLDVVELEVAELISCRMPVTTELAGGLLTGVPSRLNQGAVISDVNFDHLIELLVILG